MNFSFKLFAINSTQYLLQIIITDIKSERGERAKSVSDADNTDSVILWIVQYSVQLSASSLSKAYKLGRRMKNRIRPHTVL